MPDPFEPVKAGERVGMSASAETARREILRRLAMDRGLGGGGQPGGPLPAGWVHLRNDSGLDADRFSVLGLDAPIIGPTDNLGEFKSRPAFKGAAAYAGAHKGKFAVLQEPIAAGAIGRAAVQGLTAAPVNVVYENDRYADIVAGLEGQLSSAPSGYAEILWKEAGASGTKWAVLRLGVSPTPFYAKLKEYGDGLAWWHAGAHDEEHWCKAYPCRNYAGGFPDATEIDVLLHVDPPWSAGWAGPRDPNLWPDQVILVGPGPQFLGDYVCMSDCLDDAIGTIKLWIYDATIPRGWTLLGDVGDPVANGTVLAHTSGVGIAPFTQTHEHLQDVAHPGGVVLNKVYFRAIIRTG